MGEDFEAIVGDALCIDGDNDALGPELFCRFANEVGSMNCSGVDPLVEEFGNHRQCELRRPPSMA